VLVLERADRARERGALPLAFLCGAAATCDASHMSAPHPEGRGIATAIELALADARAAPADVGFVNVHGTGTPHNDRAEWAALATVFGPRASHLPAVATKALLGHLLGSCGALEAAATVACLREGLLHPIPDAGPLDPELRIDLVVGRARRTDAQVALCTNLAFGGTNTALVFRRAEVPRRGHA
jgi:3-oxoacyl-[acyl-carrier-protein] synthase II